MIKIKNIIAFLTVFSILFLTGCSSQKEASIASAGEKSNKNAYADIKSEEVMTITSAAEIDGNPSDAIDIYERSTEVALVRIESIDGGDNVNQTTEEYIYPFTYGKMRVLTAYKGDWKEDSIVGYTRMGGIIPFESYYESLYPEQRSKIDKNMKEDPPEYVEVMFEDDIQVEVGKTYLVYAVSYTEYRVDELPVYNIVGWQGGLREIDGNPKAKKGINVYNNYTGEWNNLEDIIPL